MKYKFFFLRRIFLPLRSTYRENRAKGVYNYMWWTGLKIIIIWFMIIIPVALILKHFVDLEPLFGFIANSLPDILVLGIFFLSESTLGIIPPDIFIIWAAGFRTPLLILLLLGAVSYAGGLTAYFIGRKLYLLPVVRAYVERRLSKYVALAHKWGGAFIIISALFPFSPFPMVVIALSLLKYPLKLLLFYAIFRIIRIIIQGEFYLKVFNVDAIFERLL